MPRVNNGAAANFQVPVLMGSAHALASTECIIPIVAPFSGRLTGVYITDTTAITASDTDYIDVTVTNKGAAGAGTTTMATGTTETTTSGGIGDVSADVATAIPLSSTYASTVFSAGDVIYVDVTFASSGAFTAGAVHVFGVPGAY